MDNSKKNKSFVIDVANERTYQNQNEGYNKAYTKWRSDIKNTYAYQYVQDTREHSYVAGEGFVQNKAGAAENIALRKCLGLMGIIMLTMLVFDSVNFFLAKTLNSHYTRNMVMFSDKENNVKEDIPLWFAAAFAAISTAKYLIAILMVKLITKIPVKVSMPHTKNKTLMICNSVIVMLMVMVIGRIASFLISTFLGLFKIDTVYAFMMNSDDHRIKIISVCLNCIILPILCEVFFRGFVLQLFRQFGDTFAILVSSILCGFAFYDVAYIGYAICCSVILGLFTIRTGSIVTPILMHIFSTLCNYMLSNVALLNTVISRIVEISVCALIILLALIVYNRLANSESWSFNIQGDPSEISFSKKVMLLISTNTVALWLVCSIILTIAGTRILE